MTDPRTPEVRPIRPGLYSVVLDGRSYEVALDVEIGAAGAEEVDGLATVDGRRVPVHIEDRRRRALASVSGSSGAAGHGTVTIAAPMPGRIVALAVAAGDAVERGQAVIVLEAMKMESTIAAPAAGIVTEALVEPGQAVKQRQPLLRIDPAG